MKCRDIKDLIMTDFLDGMCSTKVRADIERHIEKCGSCREYYEVLKEKVSGPIKDSGMITPAEDVWQSISERIYPARDERGLIGILGDLISVRRPVLALVSLMLIIFAGAGYHGIIENKLTQDYLENQMSAFTSQQTERSEGFESDIERYFF